MRATAVSRIRVCQAESCGSVKESARLWTPATSQPPKWSTAAAEYAASARVAGSFGSSSSESSLAGWSMRSPSSRATASVPKRAGTFSPAARAPCANSAAAFERPSAETSRASSAVMVTRAVGSATFGGVAGAAGVGVGSAGVVTGSVVVCVGSVVVVAGSPGVVMVGSVAVGSVVVGSVAVGSVAVGSVVVGSVVVGSGVTGSTG